MAARVVHATVVSVPDDPHYPVGSDEWNADHTITGLATVAESGSATDLATGTLPDARLSNTITAGGPTGSATVTPVITYDAHGRLTTVTTASITQPTGANPSVSVGLSAVNGSAGTFMRSDGAPALDQTAAYAFSGLSTTVISQVAANATNFTITAATQTTNTTANPTISITRTNAVGAGNSAPALLFANITNTSGGATNKIFDFQVGGITQLNLQVGGILVGANDFQCAGTLQAGAGQKVQWSGRAQLSSASTASIETAAFPLVGNATAIPAGGTAASGYKFSSTANFGVFFGSGAPSLSAAKGSLYLRSDGSGIADRAYINTDGGTTWTNLITAA